MNTKILAAVAVGGLLALSAPAEAATVSTSVSVRSSINGTSVPPLVHAAWASGRSSWTLTASGDNGPLQTTALEARLRVTKGAVRAGRNLARIEWCASGEPYGPGTNTHTTLVRWRYMRGPWQPLPPISKNYRAENAITSPGMRWVECFTAYLGTAPRNGLIELELREADRLESVMTGWEQTLTVHVPG